MGYVMEYILYIFNGKMALEQLLLDPMLCAKLWTGLETCEFNPKQFLFRKRNS
jgi:hypothetical protein